MPHISLPPGLPGILGPMFFRPETAAPLNELAEVLLRNPSSLSRGERELIAAHVSALNDCEFCCGSHSAFAALQLEGGMDRVERVKLDYQSSDVSPKLKALLAIAGQVQQGGRFVTPEAVSRARECGATDVELHDTVLIAAAFCMYNRYVDGLATLPPADSREYLEIGKKIVSDGYRAATPPPSPPTSV